MLQVTKERAKSNVIEKDKEERIGSTEGKEEVSFILFVSY